MAAGKIKIEHAVAISRLKTEIEVVEEGKRKKNVFLMKRGKNMS